MRRSHVLSLLALSAIAAHGCSGGSNADDPLRTVDAGQRADAAPTAGLNAQGILSPLEDHLVSLVPWPFPREAPEEGFQDPALPRLIQLGFEGLSVGAEAGRGPEYGPPYLVVDVRKGVDIVWAQADAPHEYPGDLGIGPLVRCGPRLYFLVAAEFISTGSSGAGMSLGAVFSAPSAGTGTSEPEFHGWYYLGGFYRWTSGGNYWGVGDVFLTKDCQIQGWALAGAEAAGWGLSSYDWHPEDPWLPLLDEELWYLAEGDPRECLMSLRVAMLEHAPEEGWKGNRPGLVLFRARATLDNPLGGEGLPDPRWNVDWRGENSPMRPVLQYWMSLDTFPERGTSASPMPDLSMGLVHALKSIESPQCVWARKDGQ